MRMNKLKAIFKEIDKLLAVKELVLVAIDGKSGAGKSTLALQLSGAYACNILPLDHFFLPSWLRTVDRLREVGGNVDYQRFKEEVIAGLKRGGQFSYRPYDCQVDQFGPEIVVQAKKLNIIEGVYSMHPILIAAYDLKIFMDISAEEQEKRILQRDGPCKLGRFLNEWIPLENRYFREMKIAEQCDIIIDNF